MRVLGGVGCLIALVVWVHWKPASLNRWAFLQRLMHLSHKSHTLERANLTQSALKQGIRPGIQISQSSLSPTFLYLSLYIYLYLFIHSLCLSVHLHTFAITDMQSHLVTFFPQSICVCLFSAMRITCNLCLSLSIHLSFKHMLIAFKPMFLECSLSCQQLWAAANKFSFCLSKKGWFTSKHKVFIHVFLTLFLHILQPLLL